MVEALRAALRHALAEDDRVVVLGEDVGQLGGVFRVTDGLAEAFGTHRCLDTPASEAGIVGLAVGMAMAGYRPVVEMQFDAFAYPAFEQIASHVAKMRNRTRGAVPLPMVIRVPYGGGIGAVEHHSDSSEAYYAHTAGLKVITPATVADAYSLLREAIEDPDPVVFLEPKRLYWTRENIELPTRTENFGTAAVRRSGTDATLVAYGPSVTTALAAAEAAADRGWDVEVLDLRTIVPLDDAALIDSVRRTRRCLIVQEASGFVSVASEIAARVQERCFAALRAPVLRVTGLDIPYPPPLLEDAHLPGPRRVLDALARLFAADCVDDRADDHVAARRQPAPRRALPAAELVFTVPDLGEGLAEAEVVEWRVAVGDRVAVDQVVAEVETAKSVVALPTPFTGTVARLHCGTGTVLPVGAPLLTVRADPEPSQNHPTDDPAGSAASGSVGGVVATSGPVLTGYGPRPADPPSDGPRSRRTPLSPAASGYDRARATPAVTIWVDTDVTGLPGRELLAHFAERCVSGLARYPELNSRIDTDRVELVRLPHVNLAFAAQGVHGLVTPVIRDAHLLNRAELAEELRRLTALARAGELSTGHTTGGTFTVNNYGVLNVDGATPLLNHPQPAMLGIGRAVDRPWAVDGRLEVRRIAHLTFTFDHRVCDGVTAANFLTHVAAGVPALTV
uniref:Dihydrolipoamide acetyltransferase component of pyruvate dehydrogenase complex n=1 Tax=Kibdelosporangium sp. AK-AA56 TaxID=1962669 RepID=A0A1Y1DBE5_9PSEU|nr:pyruvate dehydrogenase complex, E1 beta and E2 units [Kibdelosporangium sp. AK-AA56]